MEGVVFPKEVLEEFKKGFSNIVHVDEPFFSQQTKILFKGMHNDMLCQLARAGIPFLSEAAYIEATKHRGITLEGWRVVQ